MLGKSNTGLCGSVDCAWSGWILWHGCLHRDGVDSDLVWRGVRVFGFLAISPSESRRKLFMHINVTIGLLGFLGAGIRAVQEFAHAQASTGKAA